MKNNKVSLYLKLIAFFVGINVISSAISTYATYPTEQHRSVAIEASQITAGVFTNGSFDDSAFLALERKPEYQYSATASAVSGALLLVPWLVAVRAAYIYLRKTVVVKQPVVTIALLAATGSTIASVLTLFIGELVYPGLFLFVPGIEVWVQALVSIPILFAFSMLVALIAAGVAKWGHDKRHGFVEE